MCLVSRRAIGICQYILKFQMERPLLGTEKTVDSELTCISVPGPTELPTSAS